MYYSLSIQLKNISDGRHPYLVIRRLKEFFMLFTGIILGSWVCLEFAEVEQLSICKQSRPASDYSYESLIKVNTVSIFFLSYFLCMQSAPVQRQGNHLCWLRINGIYCWRNASSSCSGPVI